MFLVIIISVIGAYVTHHFAKAELFRTMTDRVIYYVFGFMFFSGGVMAVMAFMAFMAVLAGLI